MAFTVDGQGNAEESDDSRHQQKVASSVLLDSEESIGHFAGGVVQRRQRYESGPRVLDAAAKIQAHNPTNLGVTVVPTPAKNPTTSVPTKAVATSTPAPIPTTTPASTREPAPPTTTLTIAVSPIPSDIPDYSRSQWKHWADEDGDC